MAARTRFNVTVEYKWTGYSYDGLTLHLYEYPVTINDDYTVTGTRATDSDGDYIVAAAKDDGQYEFSDVEHGTYVVIAYQTGSVPQVVNGWDRFEVIPALNSDEINGSVTDTRTLKTIINEITTYILANDSGWTGTPPTAIT